MKAKNDSIYLDNSTIELELIDRTKHNKIHIKKVKKDVPSGITSLWCLIIKTTKNTNKTQSYICNPLIINPEYKKEFNKIANILFSIDVLSKRNKLKYIISAIKKRLIFIMNKIGNDMINNVFKKFATILMFNFKNFFLLHINKFN